MSVKKTMLITKTFLFRLKSSARLKGFFYRFAGSCRFVFNFGLSRFKEALADGQFLTYEDLCKELTLLKALPETEWLKECPAQILQQSLKDLLKAINSHFKPNKNGKKTGFPHFKKRGTKDSLRYPQHVRVKDGAIYLPKIGWVKYFDSRPIEGTIVQVTIKRQGKHWFVAIVCEIEKNVIPVIPRDIVGIDVGINSLAVLSTGESIENPRFLKAKQRKLAREQKKLSKKQKGSNNFKKQAQKVAKIHIDIRNSRHDFLQKVTTTIVKNHDGFALEDLTISGLMKNHKLAQSIADASWNTFISMIQYKAEWHGKPFVKIGKFVPTSKTCSTCGSKQEMPLNIRTFKCDNCGLVIDRDINASLNIRVAGHAMLKACGALGIS